MHDDYQVVAVIGDGSLTGGMALEALNDIGSKQKKMVIIFNDNNMSISKNYSGVEKRITDIRASHLYIVQAPLLFFGKTSHLRENSLLSCLPFPPLLCTYNLYIHSTI